MSYSNKEERIWLDKSLTVAAEVEIDVRYQRSGSIELVWTGQTSGDAVIKVQESDGGAWFDVAGKTETLDVTGQGLLKFTADDLLTSKLKIVLTPNTETTGTVTVRYLFKGNT